MILKAQQLTLDVGDGAGVRRLIDDVSFELEAQTCTLLFGESGAGKSTLLSVLGCLRRPTAGQVLADDLPVSRFIAEHRDRWRRQVGFMHQRLHLFEELTAIENVLIPALVLRQGMRQYEARAKMLLGLLDIAPSAGRVVARMSGGERQRVALARALLVAPPLLLLDEPTAHQDDAHCECVLAAIEEARNHGATVLVAAHDTRVRSWSGLSATLVLANGRIGSNASLPPPHPQDP